MTFTPENSFRYQEETERKFFVVERAELKIKADNKTRSPGEENPELTLSLTGFVNGETSADLDQSATVATDANIDSPPGTYPIRVSGAMDSNYSIVHIEGELKVSSKEIPEITWENPLPMEYGNELGVGE